MFLGEHLSIASVFLAKFTGPIMRRANIIVFVMAKLSMAVGCVINAIASIWRVSRHEHDAAVMQHSGALSAGRSVPTEKTGEDSGIPGFAENGLDI